MTFVTKIMLVPHKNGDVLWVTDETNMAEGHFIIAVVTVESIYYSSTDEIDGVRERYVTGARGRG